MVADSGTWHHGLMARWWAEFNTAEPEELAYFRAAVRRFGEPALDRGCGTGRILIPLLADGLDIDGSDISADMVTQAHAQAVKNGLRPNSPFNRCMSSISRECTGPFTCAVLLASADAVTMIERRCDAHTDN